MPRPRLRTLDEVRSKSKGGSLSGKLLRRIEERRTVAPREGNEYGHQQRVRSDV